MGSCVERWYRWDRIPPSEASECLRRTVIVGDRIMFSRAERRKGCRVALHDHENEQMTFVVRGQLRFWLGALGEREVVVSAGEVLHVPANLPHRVVALDDTLELNVFSPPREDWR
jgi:quercetin dioxygenase-like cupin family protein